MTLACTHAIAATSEQIESCIKKGQAYLLSQEKNGNWEAVPKPIPNGGPNDVHAGQWGGISAIATYSLLASGQDPQSDAMKRAVEFLGNAQMIGTYAISVRAQVWGFLHINPAVRGAIKRDADLLSRGMRTIGQARGMFFYTAGATPEYDHSVSQFGVLGMWACAQLGYETPTAFWAAADTGWRNHQMRDGGWCYINGIPNPDQGKVTASMTAAGVATLFITQDYLHADEFAGCRGNASDPAIEAGLKWMGDNFGKIFTDGNGGPQIYYALYGVERIGVAAGRKYLGKTDWFQAGADYLVQHQNPDGSWGGGDSDFYTGNIRNVPTTSFALLFLARGRAPIMMNKLAYNLMPAGSKAKPVVAPWNQRPRDVANITRWVGKQIEKDLNWQSTTISAPADELDDAPILYISGDKALSFSDDEQAKLKQFAEEGGIILANPDCLSKAFTDSFIKLGEKMFPSYKFAELPADHPIYTEQFPRDGWKNKPSVQFLGNGTRVLMLIAPQLDMARLWQTGAYLSHEENYQLIDDLFLYAIDKQNFLFRGEGYAQVPDDKIKPDRTISLARLSYDGNWNPEPAGWRRLAAILHNRHKVALDVQTVALGQGALDAKKFRLAHLTGTGAVTFSEEAKADLKKYVDAGGTLIVDAAGGRSEFASSIEPVLAGLFPDLLSDKGMLPLAHPLYSTTGKPAINYRRFARKTLGALNAPRLHGLEINKCLAVFYSAEDLSTGLIGQPMDGIVGYDPPTAATLMTDIILYTNPPPKPPASKPSTSPKK